MQFSSLVVIHESSIESQGHGFLQERKQLGKNDKKKIHNIQHASTGNSFFHDLIFKCITTVLEGCKKNVKGFPAGGSGKDSTCQCKRPKFNR